MFLGKEIKPEEIEMLKQQLKKYNLANVSLEIKQGFPYLADNNNIIEYEQFNQLTQALDSKEKQEKLLQLKLDIINIQKRLST